MKPIKSHSLVFVLFVFVQLGIVRNADAQCNPYIADGTLIEVTAGGGSSNEGKIYVVFGKKKHWVAGPAIFEGLGYDWSKVNKIGRQMFDSFTEGTSITTVDTNFKNPRKVSGKLGKFWFVYTNNSSETKYVAYRVKTRKLLSTNGGDGGRDSTTMSLVYDSRDRFVGFYTVAPYRSFVLWDSNEKYEEFWISDKDEWNSEKFILTPKEAQLSRPSGYTRTVDSYVKESADKSPMNFFKMNVPEGKGCAG